MNNLINYLKENRIESFFISNPENVKYVSKFTGECSYLLITAFKKFFLTDQRYLEQAKSECKDYEVIDWRNGGKSLVDAVNDIVKEYRIKSICLESDNVTHREYGEFAVKIYADIFPSVGIVENLRAVKGADEIKKIKTACEITDKVFELVLDDIKVGISEWEIASKLTRYLITEGSDLKINTNNILSGKRTSMINGIASNKLIESGDLVMINYGGVYEGYCCDMTRTVVVGKANREQKKIYNIEKKIQQAALNTVKAGVKIENVYNASIADLKNTNYFDYHYRGIGHGVGLNLHENPIVSPYNNQNLHENNIVTIEPGIYIPNKCGIRIEDTILVTKTGFENFNTATKELIEL